MKNITATKKIILSLGMLAGILASNLPSSPVVAQTPIIIQALPDPAPLHIAKLFVMDTKVGSGDEVKTGDEVEVHYTGWLYNHKANDLKGTKFDSSSDAGAPLKVTVGARQVIRGWDIGLLGLKVGGKRTLLIPAYLAYSTQGSGSIPPNTHLVFEVELVSRK